MIYRLMQNSKTLEPSSDPVLSCFAYTHENCEMVDHRLLFESLIISFVRDIKIGLRKPFVEKDNKLASTEQFLAEIHHALNYNTLTLLQLCRPRRSHLGKYGFNCSNE